MLKRKEARRQATKFEPGLPPLAFKLWEWKTSKLLQRSSNVPLLWKVGAHLHAKEGLLVNLT